MTAPDNSDAVETGQIMASLDRKTWPGKQPCPKPVAGRDWENSLGMKFKPVSHVLFCVWKTRVQDFEAFANATGYDATGGMHTVGNNGWKRSSGTWQKPGFAQGSTYPVCGVNWNDSKAFCKWLTKQEQSAGLLDKTQSYRLPTDAEWTQAVGDAKYPWGDQWPPPAQAGNYAGQESGLNDKIEGYNDGFVHTSPVGSFNPNQYGLYDLGGNLWEWCEDVYTREMNSAEVRKAIPAVDNDYHGQTKVQRGGAWTCADPVTLLSACRSRDFPDSRIDGVGFRCVLIVRARTEVPPF